jgi:hypothetical protein
MKPSTPDISASPHQAAGKYQAAGKFSFITEESGPGGATELSPALQRWEECKQ